MNSLLYLAVLAAAVQAAAAVSSADVDVLSKMMVDQCAKELNHKQLNALFSNSTIKYTATVIDGKC